MTVSKGGLLACLSIGLFLLFCSPERDNPYDPKSPQINHSQISGRIMTKVGNPIRNAQISLSFQDVNKTVATLSDTNGNYELEYFYTSDMGDLAFLSVSKSNFAQEQKFLRPDLNKTDTVNFVLDALPQFSVESIISYHERFLFPAGDNYTAIFNVKVTDQDGQGDIESVYVFMPAISDTYTLDHYPNDIYRKTVPAESLSGGSLEKLIGTDCFFEVLSVTGVRTKSSAYRLNRIIYDVPEPISPSGDTVNLNFQCVWYNLPLSFPYNYGVELYYLRGLIPELSYQTTTIPPTDTMITIPGLLTPGRYYWQALVKDGFGNISKSIQLLFYLQ